ncbi:uncharacterized protein si:ch211-243a20.3 [Erpetoichthys calabaricus]|uniref:Uncharacterized protein n=1 Tax=Erpetoichthys calabaricus TaxID=27687 RepID=A0A8C4SAD6_ERPCA|nr:uncharacterized protein si:ch211-243a20.3 [Erpetoichthys calabaricus]
MASRFAFSIVVMVMVLAAPLTGGEDAKSDYGHWNYREGADRVNVQALKSVTRILDKWGNSIFSEVKKILHSDPNSVLPEYSRVRPLSETVNDLFKEVKSLQRRISELHERLDTLYLFFRKYGYGKPRTAASAQSARGSKGTIQRRVIIKRIKKKE